MGMGAAQGASHSAAQLHGGPARGLGSSPAGGPQMGEGRGRRLGAACTGEGPCHGGQGGPRWAQRQPASDATLQGAAQDASQMPHDGRGHRRRMGWGRGQADCAGAGPCAAGQGAGRFQPA